VEGVLMQVPEGLTVPGTSHGQFETIADLAELPMGSMKRVTRGDLDLLVVHTTRGICVIDDRCPHMAAPLSLGVLEECELACPLHRAKFDLASGAIVQFPTTGGLDADGNAHAPWSPTDSEPRPEPTDLKARARAATRVRRLRYYPARITGAHVQIVFPR
jgi:nitrite reductase/ring-hydroxylating ferredoxin subunit